jgi:hypothetical protein
MYAAARFRIRAVNGLVKLPREAVWTIGGEAYAGIIRPVPDSLQPPAEFEKVEVHPKQSRNDHDCRSIATGDRRAPILGREPQGQEFQEDKRLAKDRSRVVHLAVRHERLRLGSELRVCTSFSASLHYLNQKRVLNSMSIFSTNFGHSSRKTNRNLPFLFGAGWSGYHSLHLGLIFPLPLVLPLVDNDPHRG